MPNTTLPGLGPATHPVTHRDFAPGELHGIVEDLTTMAGELWDSGHEDRHDQAYELAARLEGYEQDIEEGWLPEHLDESAQAVRASDETLAVAAGFRAFAKGHIWLSPARRELAEDAYQAVLSRRAAIEANDDALRLRLAA